jgi:hypoxanthine phosphoribosyltransferase
VTLPFDDGATTTDGRPADLQPDRETLTWQGFGDASRALTQSIVDSGWMPELIVAIARGGLLPAGAISYAIGVKAMGTMNVEFYTGVGQTLTEPQLLPPLMDVSAMDGKRVLVVDDVADSGSTLKMVMDMINAHGLSLDGHTTVKAEARSAVIYKKPRSVIEPDYMWRETDKWINFPWSTLPVIQRSQDNDTKRV